MADDDDQDDSDESVAPAPRQPAVGDDPVLFAIATLGDQVNRGNSEVHKRLNSMQKENTERHVEYLEINHRQDGQIRAALAKATEAKKSVSALEESSGALMSAHEVKHETKLWYANLPSLLWHWKSYWKQISVGFCVLVGAGLFGWQKLVVWFGKVAH